MLCFKKPTQETISDFLFEQKDYNFSYSEVRATLDHKTKHELSQDERFKLFDLDHHRVKIGSGEQAFQRGIEGIKAWKPFCMDWVELCYPEAPIAVGSEIAIVAKALGVWTISACRICYVIEELDPTLPIKRFGFAHGTLEKHVAKGEERFLVEWNSTTNEVFFEILSFSQPNSWFTKLGYPAARYIQNSFGTASTQAMYNFVNNEGVTMEVNFI